ncbi:MAG: hypothetical protein KME45_32800 [Stenomitos rutilans HA7619-LM2]|jgi:hypothetical protein|nr:hypothetical protein [Stenomitos rutilans HA7619-LM2]
MKIKYILLLSVALYGVWFYAQVSKPAIPAPPESGVGLVSVNLGNAGPEPISVHLTSDTGKVYNVRIPRCPTCQTLAVEPTTPPPCPSDTAYKKFALSPETYKVDVYDQNGYKTYSSGLNLTDGKAYKGCLFRVRTPRKHRDLQEGL